MTSRIGGRCFTDTRSFNVPFDRGAHWIHSPDINPLTKLAPRTGGIGLGLWGLVGLAILVFGFGLPPGEPPTTSMFIILMVITAASTMQAVGGIDYLVEVAKKLLKRKPAYIALVAPIPNASVNAMTAVMPGFLPSTRAA